MKGFFNLVSSGRFMDLLQGFHQTGFESLPLTDALGRIAARDIVAHEILPPFPRSTMDGFAVRARDTFGCSESEPALLTLIGEIAMGVSGSTLELSAGQTAAIWTGGELPTGADSVVMMEYTSRIDDRTIEVFRAVAPGENTIKSGEDYSPGQLVCPKGTRLRPQELGVMAGLGISSADVFKRPVVAILSTGDELVPPEAEPGPGQIRDINSTTLSALVSDAGGIPLQLGIIPDTLDDMIQACQKAVTSGADIVLFSGGSSVGRRDFTIQALQSIDGAELLAHGVSIRPGKPTILAKRDNQALFGLPGHVASAMVVFYLFVRPLIRFMGGLTLDHGLKETRAIAGVAIPSSPGREEYVRVRLEKTGDVPVAWPIWGRSGLLRPLVQADGMMVVDRDSEGIEEGETGRVLLFP